jgi:hypothetical protein
MGLMKDKDRNEKGMHAQVSTLLRENQNHLQNEMLCFAAVLPLHDYQASHLRAASLQCKERKKSNRINCWQPPSVTTCEQEWHNRRDRRAKSLAAKRSQLYSKCQNRE